MPAGLFSRQNVMVTFFGVNPIQKQDIGLILQREVVIGHNEILTDILMAVIRGGVMQM
jgi:hypothetical protein